MTKAARPTKWPKKRGTSTSRSVCGRLEETGASRGNPVHFSRPRLSCGGMNWGSRNRNSVGLLAGFLFLSTLDPFLEAQTAKAIQFTDVTAQSGIKFTHFKGNQGISINREEFGPGVCVADFDGDGWQDIYFVNGRDLYEHGISARNALYRNRGDGTFTDVTDKFGVPGTGYGLGCVWGDYDNDRFPDLFVTQYGRNVLYHNNGNGTFTDVTDKAGVGGLEAGKFHSSAAFLDYDHDGYLDLYVGSYVQLEPDGPRYCNVAANVKSSCPPQAY